MMSNSGKNLSKISAVILHSKGVSQTEVVRQAHNDEQVVGLWLHGRRQIFTCKT